MPPPGSGFTREIMAIIPPEFHSRGSAVKKAPNKRYWRIQGYDSLKIIFETTVELGQFTDDQICHLLKALAAKAGLTFPEIVGAYAKRRTQISNVLLEIRKEITTKTYSCGYNPFFVATVVDTNGRVLGLPTLN